MNYKILVDSNHILPNNYKANLKLVSINDDIMVEKKAYNKYLELCSDLSNFNVNISIKSAYLDSFSSEFSTGLLMVIDFNDDYLDIIKSRLSDYGFIVRNVNPFTIRYVGYSTAKIIESRNITLEEYDSIYNKSGILVVNKPSGMTSFDVVSMVSRILDTKRVGHTGTLDPLSSGVLVLTIGKACRIASLCVSSSKEYIATCKMGIKTDTLDITGSVLESSDSCVPDNISDILSEFNKTYMQEVPKYSAVKVNGKKLYQYARSGQDVVLPKKSVTVSNMRLISKDRDTFKFFCKVSKGTYIRSLIRDISDRCNCLMTMSDLVRVKQGKYSLDDCYSLDDISNFNFKIIPIESYLDFPIISLSGDTLFKVRNGCKILNNFNILDKVIFKDEKDIVAIYEKNGKYLKSYINFS